MWGWHASVELGLHVKLCLDGSESAYQGLLLKHICRPRHFQVQYSGWRPAQRSRFGKPRASNYKETVLKNVHLFAGKGCHKAPEFCLQLLLSDMTKNHKSRLSGEDRY